MSPSLSILSLSFSLEADTRTLVHINFLLILLNARVYVSFSLSFESQTLGRQAAAAAAALVAMNHAADRDSRSTAAAAESLVSQSAKVPLLLSSSLAPVTRGGRKEDQARKESRGEQRKKQRRSLATQKTREKRGLKTEVGSKSRVSRGDSRSSLLPPLPPSVSPPLLSLSVRLPAVASTEADPATRSPLRSPLERRGGGRRVKSEGRG